MFDVAGVSDLAHTGNSSPWRELVEDVDSDFAEKMSSTAGRMHEERGSRTSGRYSCAALRKSRAARIRATICVNGLCSLGERNKRDVPVSVGRISESEKLAEEGRQNSSNLENM